MYLKQVTLYGFKSFADRTVFDMSKGITAVLGPNGCGKSNVIDAIKWVLGESSAKNLRGTQMQDVIFAGSAGRKPLGMAEVSLVFNNEDGSLPVEYNEVCITRRLYRSGESEYEINKQPCRKRDIRDLLLDTGIGMSAYSFIEQGRVEALLQAKPAERRLVIEEAAGISKFKVRRKESLARLDRTNQSLLRVNDIVEEIEKNVARVSRQAKNAKRHIQLNNDLRACKTLHYTRQSADFIRSLDELGKQKAEIQELYSGASARAAELTNLLTQLTEEEMELSAKVEEGEREYREIQEQLKNIQIDLAANSERREALAGEKNSSEQRAAALQEKLDALAADTAAARAELATAEAEFEKYQNELNGQDGIRGELQRELSACEDRMAELTQLTLDITNRQNEIRTAEAQAETVVSELKKRLDEHNASEMPLKEKEAQLAAEREELQKRYDEAKANFDALNAKANNARENEKRMRQEAEREKDGLAAKRERIAQLDSRRSALQDLEDAHDGAFGGVKAALTAKDKGDTRCADIVGMVADLLTIPQQYAVAIETVLGGAAQNIVTRTARGASDCINYLKSNRAGRATFLPLDRITPRQPVREELLHLRGVVGEAYDLVDFQDENAKAVEYLLNGILVVENLDVARELNGGAARGVRLVTLDGEDISPHGAMTGGQGGQQRGGIIARKAEKDALTQQISELQKGLEQSQNRSRELLEQAAAAERERMDAETRLAQEIQNSAAIERDLSVKESEYQRALTDRTDFDTVKNRLLAELTAANDTGVNYEIEKEELAAKDLAAADEKVAVQTRLKAARAKLDEIGNTQADVREARGKAQGKVTEFTNRLQKNAEQEAEQGAELQTCREAAARAAADHAEVQAKLDELHTREAELLEKREHTQTGDIGDKEKLKGLREQLEEYRNEEKSVNNKMKDATEGLNAIELKNTDIKVRMESVAEKALAELEIADIAEKAREYLDSLDRPVSAATGEEIPDENAEKVLVDDVEIATLDGAALGELIGAIEDKIARLGPVNMCAIDELAELEAREEFLKVEQEDIQQACDHLTQMIDKLNNECDRKFEETFNAVRANFQDMFTYLFGGGQAELVLAEPEPGEDQLDRGIEIIARPPGKSPKSISLLSGGEKALCAVALLFAIFRSKPSPFCILDEVDGPLDESNIDRFMEAVGNFTTETQFIIISHSKRTMSMVDTIYGVTQEQPGVSTRYSLKLTNDYEGKAGLKPEDTAEAPAEEQRLA